MNYFISNLKAQTVKSLLITVFITILAVYAFWNAQSFAADFSNNVKWFPVPVVFFTPFLIEVITYTIGIALLTSQKGWMHGLVFGFILTAIFIVPDFVKYALQSEGSLTFSIAFLVIIDNIIRLAVPAALLAHLRKN